RVEQFVRRQLVEPAFVGARRDEKVAVVVGVAIEQHDAERRPQDDLSGAVVRAVQPLADEARVAGGRWFYRGHVRKAPRRPQTIPRSLVLPQMLTGAAGRFAPSFVS